MNLRVITGPNNSGKSTYLKQAGAKYILLDPQASTTKQTIMDTDLTSADIARHPSPVAAFRPCTPILNHIRNAFSLICNPTVLKGSLSLWPRWAAMFRRKRQSSLSATASYRVSARETIWRTTCLHFSWRCKRSLR